MSPGNFEHFSPLDFAQICNIPISYSRSPKSHSAAKAHSDRASPYHRHDKSRHLNSSKTKAYFPLTTTTLGPQATMANHYWPSEDAAINAANAMLYQFIINNCEQPFAEFSKLFKAECERVSDLPEFDGVFQFVDNECFDEYTRESFGRGREDQLEQKVGDLGEMLATLGMTEPTPGNSGAPGAIDTDALAAALQRLAIAKANAGAENGGGNGGDCGNGGNTNGGQ
ncbi:hypothetical protein K402DRAFT_33327 [Aulographum hederae CBS 113979]|uniref:Uncharacterized protein n=1 Tax=Aulographum hederae CBS 113979 TaxID=1176131 RepID=A0A6G1H5J0_9PEZI|nr:hypothetical protein K402DRAFT_33327 [Aulographum hederae CBS 113979]